MAAHVLGPRRIGLSGRRLDALDERPIARRNAVAVCRDGLIGSRRVDRIFEAGPKLKLIASGFAEAATAVNQAVHWIYPEKKVAPGHSSNMAIFGQKDD